MIASVAASSAKDGWPQRTPRRLGLTSAFHPTAEPAVPIDPLRLEREDDIGEGLDEAELKKLVAGFSTSSL
jgi:hypothetical protein